VAIRVATVNGSGSASANNVLMRAVFEMGIPVSGKNLFPSNIEGEPTFFYIRVNKDEFLSQKNESDILVGLCPETIAKDVQSLAPGALVVTDSTYEAKKIREDVIYLEIPFAKLVASIPDVEGKIRRLLANMVYVGVLAQLLGIEMKAVELALNKQFKGKAKAINLNLQAAKLGAEYAAKNLPQLQHYRLERMSDAQNKILIDGNTAAGIGCVMAGCTVMGWYPITPASTVCESFNALAKKFRVKDGKATYASVQAEDELAAMGIILGAGWAGARAMTATSGPGLSLMAELFGLGYYVEIPAVIFDVQRVGPSTGLPTHTMQCDILKAAYLSHGDTKHMFLIPGSVEECYSMALEAFDIAERFQTPLLVMMDLDLGMNNWVCGKFPYPEKPIERGKVLNAEQIEALIKQGKKFERYRDVDGDGIPYRTLPGTNHPQAAYFTRGVGHNEAAKYSEDPIEFVRNMDRLVKKFETAREQLPQPAISGDAKSDVGIIAYGSTDAAIPEVMSQLKARGISSEYLRMRAFPFHKSVNDFIARKKRVYVVEQNRDGQMAQLLKLDVPGELGGRIRNVAHYNGWPIDARTVIEKIVSQEQRNLNGK
jgi:2-oxoglutarate ferredoxin oxidoreductase subunit alpha